MQLNCVLEIREWTLMFHAILRFSGADPGFPVGGGANPPGGGAPTYEFAKCREKLHEIEKILGRRGGARRARPPPNPPLVLVNRHLTVCSKDWSDEFNYIFCNEFCGAPDENKLEIVANRIDF